MNSLPVPKARKKIPVSLQTVLSMLLFMVVLVVGGLLTILNYQRGREMADSASSVLFAHIQREMSLQIDGLYTPVSQLVDLTVRQPLAGDSTLAQRMQYVPSLVEAMQHSAALSAVYVGYANGDFFLVRRLNPAWLNILNVVVPAGSDFLVQSIVIDAQGHTKGEFTFLSSDLKVLQSTVQPNYVFDPRTRDWYRQAIASARQVQTKPYVFFSTIEPGITVARRNATGTSVVGADISLLDLSAMLREQKVPPSTDLVLTDANTSVLAYQKPEMLSRPRGNHEGLRLTTLTELGGERFATLAEKLQTGVLNKPFHSTVDGRSWSGRIVPVHWGGDPLYLAISVPDDELLAAASRMLNDGLGVTLILLLAAIPLAWFVAWRLGMPLRRLVRGAEAMQNFDFETQVDVGSNIREIDILTRSMNETRSTIRRFSDISIALADEQNFDRLLERILTETMSIAHADAGALYLLDDARRMAQPQLVKWQDTRLQAPPAVLNIHLPENADHPLCRTLCSGIAVSEHMSVEDLRAAGWLGEDSANLTGNDRMLAVIPLKNRREETLGAILLIGPIKDRATESHLFAFLEALSGTAAISIENKQLLKSQNDLLEAIIQVIAGAIDAKSAYTGGHCQRVPELVKMLAQAACETTEGPFSDFSLNEDQWHEVHIAGWLHDCGKMTTPEFVVDKATKLETIYDRIHEIRTRFEVLKRDRKIACLEAILGGADRATAEATLAAEHRQLDQEFAFIASCNEGTEFMAPEKTERVREIAQHTWLRTLDDRIGISWEERQRKEAEPAQPLPVLESLLADRPDHRIPRTDQDLIPPDNALDFTMKVPELLYNRGEITNLCIATGTLTVEERYKINEHIVQTIIMLNRLPFPRHLANVPEIAGGHHEKMNGSGYPKGLVKEQMSPVARMMAVADIFEALTADDRPYKKGKKLSEAVSIMIKMRDTGHLDPDVLALFFDSGIYREYARKYMRAEQIDDVIAV